MDRGTYAAASAGMASLLRLQIASNNLANVNTPGYKSQILIVNKQSFEDTLGSKITSVRKDPKARSDHERTPAVISMEAKTDFSMGPIVTTNNDLDVALSKPNQFFVVQSQQGLEYTRAGNFTIGNEGILSTADGLPVMGDGGPIQITEGGKVKISEDGTITVNGLQVGRLQVVEFGRTDGLERVGNSRFRARQGVNGTTVDDPSLITRSLEMANVSLVSGIVDLITISRGFEAYTKSAGAIDEINRSLIFDVAR